MGCFASSTTSVVVELVARSPAPVLSATPFGRLSAPGLPALAQQGPVGDAFLAFIGVPPGSAAPVREHDAGGTGGGFAPLEASCRRVAGVSRLYWCNSPRLVAPSTWCELDRGPLMVQFLRLLAVRPRFGVAWRLKCRPPRRNTLTMGCRGRGGLRCGHNGACRLCHQSFAALDRRMGPTREGRPHSRGRGRMGGPRPLARPRGVWVVWRSPRGQRLVTCRQVPVQRQSYRPWRRDTPGRTRGRREDRRSCGRSRTRGLRAGSGHRRGGPRASCRPS